MRTQNDELRKLLWETVEVLIGMIANILNLASQQVWERSWTSSRHSYSDSCFEAADFGAGFTHERSSLILKRTSYS